MPGEHEIIAIMNRFLPDGRLNRCHESDCEIITLDGKSYLFTTDEFSAEDRFCENDPRLLGWNIAAGALSDVYACSGTPLYYAHALTVASRWEGQYIGQFAKGVADALKESGARSIGGDCGRAEEWRCCVSIIAGCNGTPLTRMGARSGDHIYLSGRIGGGNIQAALGLAPLGKLRIPGVRFRLRMTESQFIKHYATCCIDTSDGVFKSLSIIADLNSCGYDLDALPYHRAGNLMARGASLPPLLLFLAECGEYELLFTVPHEGNVEFNQQARMRGLRFFPLGRITAQGRTVMQGGHTLDLSTLRIEARDFSDAKSYLEALIAWLETQRRGVDYEA
jgi:thiamine-monophosphate kinase